MILELLFNLFQKHNEQTGYLYNDVVVSSCYDDLTLLALSRDKDKRHGV